MSIIHPQNRSVFLQKDSEFLRGFAYKWIMNMNPFIFELKKKRRRFGVKSASNVRTYVPIRF